MSDAPAEPQLNAAQQEVLQRLRRPASQRPTFDTELATRLRGELENRLAEVAAAIDPVFPLFVGKRELAGVFGCEAAFLHDEEQLFAWTPPMACGAVAHKAVELGINWRSPDPAPADLVDAALDSLTRGDTGLADWLHRCGDVDRADLRSLAVSRTTAFWEGWPPLSPRWRPTTESRCRVELCGGRIQLNGKYDLTLGTPDGRRAGKVIVDLKGGRRHTHMHREDLRFYALLETLKLGTPPRTVATYYLESAQLDIEEVDENLLQVALRRTVDGIRRYAELHGHLGPPAEAIKRPGPPCRWCPLQNDCAEGQEFLAQADDDR
ncbi:MAG: PD-(D/E)XK nuclease family protein [bacterium]|nr:PD-(D/E)XK nuclease family protein [bacterium]